MNWLELIVQQFPYSKVWVRTNMLKIKYKSQLYNGIKTSILDIAEMDSWQGFRLHTCRLNGVMASIKVKPKQKVSSSRSGPA